MSMYMKIVDFYKYCKDCKHFMKKECEDPCNNCLSNPANIDSHKPVDFEAKLVVREL